MKVFVVLTLTVFTGCHANILWADHPKSQVDLVKDAFWDHVAKATRTAEDTLQMIRQSELGQDVNAQIIKNADVASRHIVSLLTVVTPLAEDLLTKVSQKAEHLKVHLEEDLSSARAQLEPYAKELKTSVHQQVEQLKQGVATHIESLDPEALKAALLQKSEELKECLQQGVKDLQSQLGPHMQEFQENVAFLGPKFQDIMSSSHKISASVTNWSILQYAFICMVIHSKI